MEALLWFAGRQPGGRASGVPSGAKVAASLVIIPHRSTAGRVTLFSSFIGCLVPTEPGEPLPGSRRYTIKMAPERTLSE
jgi:hypothetical protein